MRVTDGAPPSRRARQSRLRPGWPLTAVFVGFPLWWVLGLSGFVGLIAAGLMLLELVRRRTIAVPRGFGWWLLFLAVYLVGVGLLTVNAPGALPENSSSGVVTWAYRLAWYLAATVVMLYVGNLRREVPLARIARSFGWMFVVVVAGGFLGVLAPRLDFPSLLEVILPRSLTHVEFVRFLIHPQVSQLSEGAVTDTPRPSAPFPYANIWGLSYACFLPFFLVGWWHAGSRRHRIAVMVVLPLSVIPVLQSLNRGLWATLALIVVFAGARAAAQGRVRAAAALVVVTMIAAVVLVTGPAAEMIQTRLDNPTSNDSRTSLARQTVLSVAEGSPVVGFGNTRDPQTSFYSIAGGASAACPNCSPPSLGTQGHLWLVIYTQGILGLLLYAGFFLSVGLRAWRSRSPYVTAGLAVLIVHGATSLVYDAIGIVQFAMLGAVAMIWRVTEEPVAVPAAGNALQLPLRTTGAYTSLVRRHRILVAGATVMGVGAGVLWQFSQGVPSVGNVSLVLPAAPSFVTAEQGPATMDNEAAFARSAAVMGAMEKVTGHPVPDKDLVITATPNTRILNLRFSSNSPESAEAAVAAAAQVVLAQRTAALRDGLASATASLAAQQSALQSAVRSVNDSEAVLQDLGATGVDPRVLEETRARLLNQAGIVVSRQTRVAGTLLTGGAVVRPPTVRSAGGAWRVSAASGGILGLLLGLLVAYGREVRGDRLGRRRGPSGSGLNLLATVEIPDAALAGGRGGGRGSAGGFDDADVHWPAAVGLVLSQRPATCVAVRHCPRAEFVAGELDRWVHAHACGDLDGVGGSKVDSWKVADVDASRVRSVVAGTVLLVAEPHARTHDVVRTRIALERSGQSVLGLVLVAAPGGLPGAATRTTITRMAAS